MAGIALNGIKVVETATYIAGPLAAKILRTLGAEVIKIENKKSGGCPERTMGQPYLFGEDGYQVSSQNNTLNGGGKLSMTLDYTKGEGLEIFKKMLMDADVYIDNNPVGRSEKLGLGWEDLHNLNPRLIVARVTGYGLTTPSTYQYDIGYDPIFQGRAGMMSVTGEPDDDRPVKAGVAVGDMNAATWVALGIMVSLWHRETSGEGQLVDYAMQDGMLAMMENMVAYRGFTGKSMGKMGGRHPMVGPFNYYKCGDGKYLFVACANNKQAYQLFDAINRPDLKEYPGNDTQNGIVANYEVNEGAIAEFLSKYTMQEAYEYLHGVGVACGQLYDTDDIFNDPYFWDRGIITKVMDPHVGEIAVPGTPLGHLSTTPAIVDASVTDLGVHNAEVLKRYGYTDEQIAELETQDVI